jgi:biopolymer transport protein ExbD
MTTQFKKPDVEQIKPPSSISEKLLPDGNLMTINVTKEGKFYFGAVENFNERSELLDKMGAKYGLKFSDEDKVAFFKTPAIGVPVNQLKSFLQMPEDQRKLVKVSGVPMDSVNKQLIDWVSLSLEINPDYKLAIKGDGNTNYPKIKGLFEGLRDIEFYKFWLITNQETNKQ